MGALVAWNIIPGRASNAIEESAPGGREAAVHGLCEDYRAAAGIDLEHDRADRMAGKRLAQPLMVLWGANGVIQRCFEPLAQALPFLREPGR